MLTLKYDSDDFSFGETLKKIRKSRGMTQDQVADIIKISKNYISRIEKGDRVPSHHIKNAIVNWIENRGESSSKDGNIEGASQDNFSISEMITKTVAILESKTVYKSALASNINSLYQALRGELEMEKLSEKIKGMETEMKEMKEMLLSLGATLPHVKRDEIANG